MDNSTNNTAIAIKENPAVKALGETLKNALAKVVKPTIKTRVSVGKVSLPLHMSRAERDCYTPENAQKKMLHHMAMQEMAGFNWRGEPKGFRIAPTSRKNPAAHRPGPATRVEALRQDGRDGRCSMSHPSLSNAEAERLEMLAEEAAEVVQAATKVLRHGYGSHHPDFSPDERDNRSDLRSELNDVLAVAWAMEQVGDIREVSLKHPASSVHSEIWLRKKMAYTNHQGIFDPEAKPGLNLRNPGPSGAVIVHGPEGCGKTRNAEALQKALGCETLVDPWWPNQTIP